ncbi:MAG: UDP-N-acetylmuramoyl-tripeptide--D-alanyl-D-alanine ligase [Anaerolineae bacterium]|jgi:UDP-N-acetylmuramoyl-tripeptide--D-alanyl-D-alanine ligase
MGPDTLRVSDLLAALAVPQGGGWADSGPEIEIRNAVIDSRLATPGSLFIALRGENQDGHEFIPEALAQGAVAVIAERVPAGIECRVIDTTAPDSFHSFQASTTPTCIVVRDSLKGLQQAAAYWRRRHEISVVGITGSIGKTTSKEVIAAVLRQQYRTLKSEGNYNNEIGLPLTLLHLTGRHEQVVLEMGMYDVGEIALLADIALPRIGVVTNVGPSHLGRLGSIERIAQAKAELPQALPAAQEGGVAILNIDDKLVWAMRSQTRARVFAYGLDQGADLWASDIESEGLEGIRFRLHYGRESIHGRVPMLGRHSVHTALRAAAVGLVEGLQWDEIMRGLKDQDAQIRLVAVPGPANSTILDDTYNSSPASCVAALNMLDEVGNRGTGKRKIAVLGDMYELGSYEQEAHQLVGRRARETADILVTVGDLGRMIGEEALHSGMDATRVYIVETNNQAIDLLQSLLEAGPGQDIILVKGSRGMQMEEIVAALQEGDTL